MYHLCTSMSNDDIVSSVLTTRRVSSHFLNYLSVWLRYRKNYCKDEGRWDARSICKTPFEETMDHVQTFVKGAKNSRTDAAFHNLLYAVSDGI